MRRWWWTLMGLGAAVLAHAELATVPVDLRALYAEPTALFSVCMREAGNVQANFCVGCLPGEPCQVSVPRRGSVILYRSGGDSRTLFVP